MDRSGASNRDQRRGIAHRAMAERGLLPDFSTAVIAETETIGKAATDTGPSIRDLRDLLWCSIDNDDSRDLDQLTVTAPMKDGTVKVLVAVADVDALVQVGSAIDGHARANTTSVYTAAEIFPMLPEKLSTDLTSLGQDQARLAVVVEMVVGADGTVAASDVYRALVRNRAKLLIEDFMIAANGVTAKYLEAKGLPSLRRVLRAPRALGAPRRAGRRPGRPASDRAGRTRARGVPRPAPPRKSGAVPRPLSLRRQAARPGRVRRRAPGAVPGWPLRAGHARLLPFHRPQPALSGSGHRTSPEGGDGGAAGALRCRRPGRAGESLHRAGGQRGQGRATGPEVGGGAPPGPTHRPAVRRDRDRRVLEGHLGPHPAAPGGRKAGPWIAGARRRRPRARHAARHRRRARLHRLRPGVGVGRTPGWSVARSWAPSSAPS